MPTASQWKTFLEESAFRDERVKYLIKVRDIRIERLEAILRLVREKTQVGYIEEVVRQALTDEFTDELFEQLGMKDYPEDPRDGRNNN